MSAGRRVGERWCWGRLRGRIEDSLRATVGSSVRGPIGQRARFLPVQRRLERLNGRRQELDRGGSGRMTLREAEGPRLLHGG